MRKSPSITPKAKSNEKKHRKRNSASTQSDNRCKSTGNKRVSKSRSASQSRAFNKTPVQELSKSQEKNVPRALANNLVQSGMLLQNIEKLMKFLETHCHDCPEFATKF